MGADALYVNFDSKHLIKLTRVFSDLLNDDGNDECSVIESKISYYQVFNLFIEGECNQEVTHVCELKNESDAWRTLGNAEDLICVVFEDCSVKIFDIATGDLLKVIDQFPLPFTKEFLNQCEVLDAAVCGDQLVVLTMLGQGLSFNGPVLLYLDDRLEYCIRA